MSRDSGQVAEDKALHHLDQQGLRLVKRNYYCLLGEIDLIMRDGQYLVFVEVRARSSKDFGGGAVSITVAKQKKIVKTAMHYLMVNRLHDKFPLRFDAISIDGKRNEITWIKDAFGADVICPF